MLVLRDTRKRPFTPKQIPNLGLWLKASRIADAYPSISGTPAATEPSYGAELVADVGFEANYTAGKCDTFSKSGSPTLAQSADVHGGSKAQQFTATAQNDGLYATPTAPALGAFLRYSVWGKRTAGSSGSAGPILTNTTLPITPLVYYTDAAYTQKVAIGQVLNTAVNEWPVRDTGAAGWDTVILDDRSLKTVTLASTLRLIGDPGRRNGVYTGAITIPNTIGGNIGGLAACVDSESNPTYGIFAWCDRTNVVVKKLENGTWTQLINTATGVTYADTRRIRLAIDGSSVSVYYESALGTFTQIGTTQTVTLTSYGTKFCAFDPSGICTFGTYSYSASGASADADRIHIWPDLSANGYNAVQEAVDSQPTLQTAEINGKSAVRFDGINDYMSLSGAALGLVQNVAGVTVFVAAQTTQPGTGTPQCLFGVSVNGSGNTRFGVFRESTTAGNLEIRARRLDADSVAQINGAQFRAGDWNVVTSQVDYAAQTALLRKDGLQISSGSAFLTAGSTSDTASSTIHVGALNSTFPTSGDIAEVLVFSRALNAGEIRRVELYLAREYGIGLGPLVSGTPAATAPSYTTLIGGATLNGNMETGSPPSNWTAENATLAADAEAHSGSQALKVTATAANGKAYQLLDTTVGRFYRAATWMKPTAGDTARLMAQRTDTWASILTILDTDSAAYGQLVGICQAMTATTFVQLGSPNNTDILLADDVSIESITLASTLRLIGDPGRRNGEYYLPVTVNSSITGNMAGHAICVDDPTNPLYGIWIWTDRTNLVAKKLVNGTWTQLISTATGVTYGAGKLMWLTVQGTTVKAYYESTVGVRTQIGADQTVDMSAWPAGATKWCAFSPSELNSFGPGGILP